MVESNNSLSAAQQETFVKLVDQLKNGCVKEFCFNANCAKNYFGKFSFNFYQAEVFNHQALVSLNSAQILMDHMLIMADLLLFFRPIEPVKKNFTNDVDYEIYARQTVSKSQGDHEELICSQVRTVNRSDLRSATPGKYILVCEMDHQFFWLIYISFLIVEIPGLANNFRRPFTNSIQTS